jgi:hypothetical protein
MPNDLDYCFQEKKACILSTTCANISMICVQNNGDSYFFVFRHRRGLGTMVKVGWLNVFAVL